MLTKITVEGFKNFKDKFCFDLTKTKQYSWNKNHVVKGNVKNGIVYGLSGSGKTNIANIILDAKSNIDPSSQVVQESFLNASKFVKSARFEFVFDYTSEGALTYSYEKDNYNSRIKEGLYLGELVLFEYDYENKLFNTMVEELENLKIQGLEKTKSALSFIYTNSNLEFAHPINYVYTFFVTSITAITTLTDESIIDLLTNSYIEGVETFNTNVKKFFNECGFEEYPYFDVEKKSIDMNYPNGRSINFQHAASNGQIGLLNFFTINSFLSSSTYNKVNGAFSKGEFIFKNKKHKVSTPICGMFYFDEFDAFYDNKLSKLVLDKVFQLPYQTIVTTHNTNLISNNILRPDCYFEISNGEILSLSERTDRELRFGHSLEKMFNSGAFEFSEEV